MKPWIMAARTCLFAVFLGMVPSLAVPDVSAADQNADSQALGISQRTPWSTSRITGSPDPPSPYRAERVFPALKFDQPVDITSVPGSDRLFVAEQAGRVYSFPNRADAATATLAVDCAKDVPGAKQLYAITFHPDFPQNRYCYLCCIFEPEQEDGSKIIRFRVTESDPPTLDPASQTVIFTWLSGGHNGCALKFGPDGYLYISTGDAVGPNPPDTKRTGQDISDVLSSVLRIDVDRPDDGRNYRIPPDNPFVDTPGARGEVWAYGFRNPWRMSFDRRTGDLWVGDVGWELWELLNRVERGGNYGWSVMEGRQPTNPEWPRGPTPILPPTIEHPHSEASSITAGAVYYGSRLPELDGAHIYGDYDTGKIWAARWEDGRVAFHEELLDTTHRIVGFCDDHDGEVYWLHHLEGTIYRLTPNPESALPSQFPRRLSETGLFTDVAAQTPAPGVVPYSINAAPWEDGAQSQRWVALPGTTEITAEGAQWKFPENAVFVKTRGTDVSASPGGRPVFLETQLLHFSQNEWRAYTYAWNEDQTDAFLVDAAGKDAVFQVPDEQSPDGVRRLKWHYASRAECLRCHNPWAGSALGYQAAQLNCLHDYAGHRAPQLPTLQHMGLLPSTLPDDSQLRLADPRDEQATLDQRARSYLHTNCAHCHRLHAGSSVLSKLQFDLPLGECSLINERPSQGTFGIPFAKVISPGDPYRSVLLYRMAKVGSGHMPHIGSELIDLDGLALIEEWIRSLPNPEAGSVDQEPASAEAQQVEEDLLSQVRAARDAASVRTAMDQLLTTTTGALRLARAIDAGTIDPGVLPSLVERGAASDFIPVRDLFERYLPEERRVKRLGSIVRPEEILALSGDAVSGRRLYFEAEGVQCRNCHRVQNSGREVGPALDGIGKKLSPAQLLESILDPSKVIDPKFVSYALETKAGQIYTGLLMKQDGDEVVLKDAQDRLVRVPTREVEQLVAQRASLMPELLARDLTAQQLADLLAFLNSPE